MATRDYSKGYSGQNKDKYDNVREEGSAINKIVITVSVAEGSLDKTLTTLHSRGASVHYLIDKDGTQYQEHNDYFKTFFAAYGKFKGESTNETGISIMLINDAESGFPDAQMDKLILLVHELQNKHGITDVFGLNEVYSSFKNGAPVFMEAPGTFFPWIDLQNKNIGKAFTVEGVSNKCIENPSSEIIQDLQNSLQTYGYNIPTVNGELDSYTQHYVNAINYKYGYENSACVSDKTIFIAHELAGLNSHSDSSELVHSSEL